MKKIFFIAAFLLGISMMQAAPVNSNTALRVAENFWRSVTGETPKAELVGDAFEGHAFGVGAGSSDFVEFFVEAGEVRLDDFLGCFDYAEILVVHLMSPFDTPCMLRAGRPGRRLP